MAKDILKEAIADAKAVREVALANAKAALEEAFTPKLQSMLSAKLSEDLDESTDETLEEYGSYEEDGKDKKDMDEMMYDEDGQDEEMEEEVNLDEEIDLEEILNELELEESDEVSEDTVDEAKDKDDKDSMEEAKKDDDDKKMEEAKDKDDKDSMEEAKDKEEEMEEGFQSKPNATADDVQNVTYKADYIYEDSKEFDLDALLEEINNLDENEENEVNEAEESVEESVEETNEAIGMGLAGIASLVAAAGGMAKLKMMFQDPEMQAKYPTATKVLGALEDAGSAAGQAMRRENEEMAEELEETKKALKTVKSELNEVNLLNSKLLYVNRIFKANQLDEAQKLRVVETLDNATNTKEAKLIYETIKDTFNVAKSKEVSKNSKSKSLKEGLGMASKAAGTSTAPKKEVISESNNMITRFQKLANIKINE